MLDVVHMWNDEVEAFYSDQIVNQKRIYSQRFASSSHSCLRLVLPRVFRLFLKELKIPRRANVGV